jgi:hypothetical protein
MLSSSERVRAVIAAFICTLSGKCSCVRLGGRISTTEAGGLMELLIN